MVAAFTGWPDAGQVASGGVAYLRDKLEARKFAHIQAEEFYIFTRHRPHIVIDEGAVRRLSWPVNEFYYWQGQTPAPDLVIFLGAEPHLKWHTYVDCILDIAQECHVERLISLGGTLDSVPHTMDCPISGSASEPRLREKLQRLSVRSSNYQGPTSIHSLLMDTAAGRGMATASLWGHAPHYLQSIPNPKVTYRLLDRLSHLLEMETDLEELKIAAATLVQKVDEALLRNPELLSYVRRLEEIYQETATPPEESTVSDSIFQELEDFLRQHREKRTQDDDPLWQ